MKNIFLVVLILSGIFSEAQIVRKYSNEFLNMVPAQPSAGIGSKYQGLTLDYAITDSGIGGSNFFSNFCSLKLDMGDFRN